MGQNPGLFVGFHPLEWPEHTPRPEFQRLAAPLALGHPVGPIFGGPKSGWVPQGMVGTGSQKKRPENNDVSSGGSLWFHTNHPNQVWHTEIVESGTK